MPQPTERPPSEQTFENAVVDLLVDIRNLLADTHSTGNYSKLTYRVKGGRHIIEAASPEAVFQGGTGHNP